MMQITETVKQLIIINVIFFIGSELVSETQAYLSMYYFENPMFRFWQPLTSMFMHGNLPHILLNMFGLFMFGSTLEKFWGAKRFLFFYISCGLGAGLVHQGVNYYEFHTAYNELINSGITSSEINKVLESNYYIHQIQYPYNNQVVGASGALYGLLVAFAFMFPNVELMLMFIPIPIKAKYFVPALMFLDLILGLNGNSIFGASTGIAHFAHLGGALTGFLIMWYWKKNNFNQNRWN